MNIAFTFCGFYGSVWMAGKAKNAKSDWSRLVYAVLAVWMVTLALAVILPEVQ